MNGYKLLLLLVLSVVLQACASGPGKPGVAPDIQPSPTPSNDYMYRSPPPDVARALQ